MTFSADSTAITVDRGPKWVRNYLDLITSYHRGKPRFAGIVDLLTSFPSQLGLAALRLPKDFDLDLAVGPQLDAVGVRIGISRDLLLPIPVPYFTINGTVAQGFNSGVWRGPFDADEGIVRLDDDDYRFLLRAKISANNWDGTIAGMKAALDYVFASTSSRLFFEDRQNMSMLIGVAGPVPSLIVLAILSRYLPLKPAGVRVDYVVASTPQGGPLFGFNVSSGYVAGFNQGVWARPAADVIADGTT